MTISTPIEIAKESLDAERINLIHQLNELGADESGELSRELEFDDGFADAGAATAERTEVIGLVESLKVQLQSVDRALERVEEGMYGVCSSCGNEIQPARLEARPASTLCFDCKSRAR